MAVNYVKFQRGSESAYLALKNADRLDENTLYFIYKTNNDQVGSLYLGERLISGGDVIRESTNLDDLKDVVATGAATNSFLVRDGDKWVAKSLDDVIDLILGNVTLSDTKVYQVVLEIDEAHQDAIARVVGGELPNPGDIAIVKDEFVSGKIEHTAYVYDKDIESWVAMDGNYNANNVYFDEDFVFTKSVGTVAIPSSGNIKVDAAGKNLKEFFAALFAAEEKTNLIQTEPYVSSLTIGGAGSYEVGSVINPTYSAVFNAGSYKYGPSPTGASVSGWNITSTNGDNLTNAEASGNLNTVNVKADTYISFTATANYDAGQYAKTNLGNISTLRINAGSKSKTETGKIQGYRNTFYGSIDNKNDLTV